MRYLLIASALSVFAIPGVVGAHPAGHGHHTVNTGQTGFASQPVHTGYYIPQYRQPVYQPQQQVLQNYQPLQYQAVQPASIPTYQVAPALQTYAVQPAISYGTPAPVYQGLSFGANGSAFLVSNTSGGGKSSGTTSGSDRERNVDGVTVFGPPR